MQKLEVEFENCYGIKKLDHEFNFTPENNVNIIYAKNGLMKTSFTKVFKKFQDNKESEIKDLIFNAIPVKKNIKVDDNNIEKEDIFVINSFEKAYESGNISSLLINENMRIRLTEIIRIKNLIFENLKEKSGLDINKAITTKGFIKLEEQVLKDFNFVEQSFLQNIESIDLDVDYDYSDIEYSHVFHKATLKNIKTESFQSSIREYIERSNEIYEEYSFFDSGSFNLPKLKNLEKEIKKSSLFNKPNKLYLHESGDFADEDALSAKIREVESRLQDTKAFKTLDKALGTIDGKFLKDIIENNPDIIEELAIDNLENFRQKLWISYFRIDEESFITLKENYLELIEEIRNLDINATLWKKSVDIFNNRFNLPFTMSIENPISSITGESIAKIIFNFINDNGEPVSINREELENKDTLSQGEKRALYLLNIIFDVEKRKNENQKTLFIIDDIADSFDYKNKYAIIEYLKDISKENDFYMIILSHNFDFYRAIAGRLDLPPRENRFHAIKYTNEIKLVKEHYQKQPFQVWKKNLDNKKYMLALIPFIRNLIEYGIDNKKDYIFLTHLLHMKVETKYKSNGKVQLPNQYDENNGDFTIPSIYDINIGQLKLIYKKYIDKDNFHTDLNAVDKIYDLVLDIADTEITDDDINLENKIILALAIRLRAEKFMINSIETSTINFSWKSNIGNSEEFLKYVNTNGNQTRTLFNGYIQIANNESKKILDSVNIMTPENIHINSFMYEPLLDMDILELKNLYNDVKNLELNMNVS